jgi:hypothetical protein
MSIGGVTGSVAAAVTTVYDGDADDDTADDGVGGPEFLQYIAGEIELCLLPRLPVFVLNDVGILGSMRRKLHARFVCAQLPQDGLFSSHWTPVRL